MSVSSGKRKYMINDWWGAQQDGTSCIFHTEDEKLWWEEINKLAKAHNFTYDNCRIVIRDNLSIFSFASTILGMIAYKSSAVLGGEECIVHPFGSSSNSDFETA